MTLKAKKGYKFVKGLFGKYDEIPEEWEIVKIEDLFEFIKTGTNPRSDLGNGNIMYIHYGDIHTKWDNILDCDSDQIPLIDKTKVVNLPLLKDDDLVIADASEDYEGSGSSVLLKNIKNKKIVSGLHTIVLRDNNANISSCFKVYLMSIKSVKIQIIAYVTGVAVYGLSKENLKKIKVPIPYLPEQQKIASILSGVDALIQNTQQVVDKSERLKKGLMQKLLTRGIGHTKFKKVPWLFGKEIEIPEEWNVETLGSTCDQIQDMDHKMPKKISEGVPFLSISDIVNKSEIDFSNQKYISKEDYADFLKKLQPQKNDLLYSRVATIGESRIIREKKNFAFTYNVVLIKTGKKLVSLFLKYALDLPMIKNHVKSIAPQGTYPFLGLGDIEKIPIIVPPLLEQQKIASILSGVDALNYAQFIIITSLRIRSTILLILFATVLHHEFYNTEKDIHHHHNT